MIPTDKQYTEKICNFLLLKNLNNNFKEKYVTTPLTINAIKYGNQSVLNVVELKKSPSFKIIAPILTGINMKKEKSRAAFCVKPPNIPPVKVAPLREIPGSRANN